MGQVSPVPSVKFFVITLHRDPEIVQTALTSLQQEFGKADFVSEDFPFEVTSYYENEMGANLMRRICSFERLITPDLIAEAKRFTNNLEEQFRSEKGRQINLDPGYLDYYKVVLASTKYGGQKIYLANGIYADMTLVMYKGKWESFDWSFPDFRSGLYAQVLSRIRDLYKTQVKALKPS